LIIYVKTTRLFQTPSILTMCPLDLNCLPSAVERGSLYSPSDALLSSPSPPPTLPSPTPPPLTTSSLPADLPPAPEDQEVDVLTEVLTEVPGPPPPPRPRYRQPVILYQTSNEQSSYFYNPETMFNQREFIIRPEEEYILLMYGTTQDRLTENQLICPATLMNQADGQLKVWENIEPQVLCLSIKHSVPDMTLLVPIRTPLSFLLKATQLQVKMYSISTTEAQRCKEDLLNNWHLNDMPPVNAPHRLVMFDDRRRPAPYHVPPPNVPTPRNLLLRRVLNFPYQC